MSIVTTVLASASTGRLSVLKAAGVEPIVRISEVDEDAILASLVGQAPEQRLTALAMAKAEAVVTTFGAQAEFADAVVIGGDSMLLLDGELQGKPHTPEMTRQRWAAQAGRQALLLTGHAVLRVRDGEILDRAGETASAMVRIGTPTTAELEEYIATGEPLSVAGALTIDGIGGWFVDGIDGDPSCVVGLSLPLVRRLVRQVGIAVTDLWTVPR